MTFLACVVLSALIVFCTVKIIHIAHYMRKPNRPEGYLAGNIIGAVVAGAVAFYVSHWIF